MARPVMVFGGGDLASGVALRLARIGAQVFICELEKPLAVRRRVAFAEAIYRGEILIEEIRAKKVDRADDALDCLAQGIVPVLVDPLGKMLTELKPVVLVDGRMTKQAPGISPDNADLVIGLGPGFVSGLHCHAVIETKRGPHLGRVIWNGSAEADTGLPETVANHQADRVLRSPGDGVVKTHAEIGDIVAKGQLIAEVNGQAVRAAFAGVLRGLLYNGLQVTRGAKIGDVDPRPDPLLTGLVSDKALAVGGGVLEAILTRPEIRRQLWDWA
jgi:xanthine dehydrogenase accessory factor